MIVADTEVDPICGGCIARYHSRHKRLSIIGLQDKRSGEREHLEVTIDCTWCQTEARCVLMKRRVH